MYFVQHPRVCLTIRTQLGAAASSMVPVQWVPIEPGSRCVQGFHQHGQWVRIEEHKNVALPVIPFT